MNRKQKLVLTKPTQYAFFLTCGVKAKYLSRFLLGYLNRRVVKFLYGAFFLCTTEINKIGKLGINVLYPVGTEEDLKKHVCVPHGISAVVFSLIGI